MTVDAPTRATWLRFLAIAVLLIVAAHLADRWAYEHIVLENPYGDDLGRMLRVQGFFPLWVLAALALVLNDWHRRVTGALYPAIMRGWLLFASVTSAGIAAEILKLLFRRERPRAHAGEYVFRSFSERTFSTGGLALPSSHAIIAFGAACMLARLFPRAWPIWYMLAAGCGLTRVLDRAHFVSDVVVSALVAWAIAAWLWTRHRRRIERVASSSAAST